MIRRLVSFVACALIPALSASAFERGDWLQGSANVVDGHTLLIEGQSVALSGIIPMGGRSVCGSGGRRLPCKQLALTTLAGLVSNRPLICEITEERPNGVLAARCIVENLDISDELIRLGVAEADPNAPPVGGQPTLAVQDEEPGTALTAPVANIAEQSPAVETPVSPDFDQLSTGTGGQPPPGNQPLPEPEPKRPAVM